MQSSWVGFKWPDFRTQGERSLKQQQPSSCCSQHCLSPAEMAPPACPAPRSSRSCVRSWPKRPPQPELGLTAADLEEAIRAAMADMPQPQSGLSQEEIERIVEAAIASIPTSQPGLTSTQVEDAIRAALAAMPQPESGLSQERGRRDCQSCCGSHPTARARSYLRRG